MLTPSPRCTSGTYIAADPFATVYVSCVHTSAAAVTIVDVAVIVATTAAAIDTAYRKSKMIKFQLLYNGGNLLISGTSGPRKPGRGSLSSGPSVLVYRSEWEDARGPQWADIQLSSRNGRHLQVKGLIFSK